MTQQTQGKKTTKKKQNFFEAVEPKLFKNLVYIVANLPGFVYWKVLNSRYMLSVRMVILWSLEQKNLGYKRFIQRRRGRANYS